jgi:hypothetical protein
MTAATTATKSVRRTAKITKPAEEKTVLVLNRYFCKRSGAVILHVRNGKGLEYCVTLRADGTVDCYGKNDQQCKGHMYAHHAGHECHHIMECQRLEAERAPREVVAPIAEVVAPVVVVAEEVAPVAEETYTRVEISEETKAEIWTAEELAEIAHRRENAVKIDAWLTSWGKELPRLDAERAASVAVASKPAHSPFIAKPLAEKPLHNAASRGVITRFGDL